MRPHRVGDFISCTAGAVTGLSADGGYGDYVVAPADARWWPSPAATTAAVGGLRHRGRLVVVGVPEEALQVPAVDLILASRLVAGHASGTAKDSEDTLCFAALAGSGRWSRRWLSPTRTRRSTT